MLTPEKIKIIKEYLADSKTVGGRDRCWGHIRIDHPTISRRDVAAVIAADPIAQTHQPLNKRSSMRQIIVRGPATVMQVDLVDMQKLASHNGGVRYLLTAIDIFSKYCAIRMIKNKTAPIVTAALKDILDNMDPKWRPRTVQTDNGAEFKTLFERTLHARGIKTIHSLAYSPSSQGCIERANRTIKSAIFTLMDRNKTKNYAQYVDDLVTNFNTTIHGTTNYTPREIMQNLPLSPEAIAYIQNRMREKNKHIVKNDYVYDIGDIVRVALTTIAAVRRETFRKKIKANWSTELFEIYSISQPVTAGTQVQYLLKNLTTNRKSSKKYWNYQLKAASIPDEEESEALLSDEEASDEPEEVARLPVAPRSRGTRDRVLSATALRNIVNNDYY